MSTAQVTWGIAKRSLLLIPRLPSTFVPNLLMPIFIMVAFSGAFAGIANLPGFPAEKMIDWMVPMAAVQGAAFAGVTTGMAVARDLQNGFYDRFLASPASRTSLLLGPIVAAMFRSLMPFTLLVTIGFFAGANFHDGIFGVVALALACLGVAVVGAGWSLTLALNSSRSRSRR